MGRQNAFAGRNQNAVAFRSRERSLGPVSNTIMLIIMALFLGLLYLTQVTKTNAYGYKVSGLLQQQTRLQQQNQELQIASAREQSVATIQNSDQAKALVPTSPSGVVTN